MHPFIRSASEKDDSYWWYGWGWYRKRFTIDKCYASRLISLEFDGCQKPCGVYVNGALVGEHKGGYTSFSVDINRQVKFGQCHFSPTCVKRTIALHGSDRNVFEFSFIAGGGHRPYFLTRPAALWLARHLNFPNWTPESIAKMPETLIMDWARGNHVFIDKLYATELREGGTRAIGVAIPAVPHDDLNALPIAAWQRDRDKYVYETWVKNAKARLTPRRFSYNSESSASRRRIVGI